MAGLELALRLVEAMRFGAPELEYLGEHGFDESFLDYLSEFRFSGDIDAIPEGTVVCAGEPLDGRALLVPAMRATVLDEPLERLRPRARCRARRAG